MGRRHKALNPEEIRKLAAIGATIREMCDFFHCSHGHLNRHYQHIIEEGRASGILAAKGRLYRRAMDGQTAALEFYLANTAGWSPRPSMAVVTNVVQHSGGPPGLSEAETKALLVKLQLAVFEEARAEEAAQNQARTLP